ncbi:MAG: DUF2029 domain-containing protein, partial [Rhodospirillales bacterium]|nr:DUF2029 domain-containing protein [Rhodospirillales bacterium]
MTARGGMRAKVELGELTGRVWQILLWACLSFFWLIWFEVFCGKMFPRLGYLFGQPIGNDPPCIKPECDFSDFWRAGFSARFPEAQSVPGNLASSFVPGVRLPVPGGYHEGFPYPPPALLPAAAISHLPFELGFFVWAVCMVLAAVAILRWAKLPWLVILAGILSPAALWNTELGQFGVICGAILVAGLLRLPVSSVRAGFLLGLLTCKPQYGLLIPATLFGSREMRGFLAISASCLIIFLFTILSFGPQIWLQWLGHGQQGGVNILSAGFNPRMAQGTGVSVLWMLHSLRVPHLLATVIQTFVSIVAMVCCIFVWRWRNLEILDATAMTVLLSLLATPYGYVDDMVGVGLILA